VLTVPALIGPVLIGPVLIGAVLIGPVLIGPVLIGKAGAWVVLTRATVAVILSYDNR
jgi:hypothetical protein